MVCPEVFMRYFPLWTPGYFCFFTILGRQVIFVSLQYMQDWNNAIELSQVFQEIARFERFADLNLLEYAFNVIQNWETDALQFYLMVLTFCQQLRCKEIKVAG